MMDLPRAHHIGDQHKTLESLVCDELRRWIVDRKLPPGSRLIEHALARELDVSRGPVREAIRQLEREGFVTISPRRGASVAEVSVDDALACYEVRIALEGVAGRRAAERRSDADIERLDDIIERGNRLVLAGGFAQLALLNNEFHEALARASRNSQLVVLMGESARRIAWIFARSARYRGADSWREHEEVVAAVRGQDADAAEHLASTHIENSRAHYLQAMELPPLASP